MTSQNQTLAAVLLAAGASERMGRPKPLLDFQGETFLDRHIGLFTRFCGQVFVVLGYHAAEIAAGVRLAENAVLLLNPHPERGQLSSLQCGLRALPAHIEGVFFQPVDGPGAHPSTIASMCEAWQPAGPKPELVIPRHAGKGGHPVLLRSDLTLEILALADGATARDVVWSHQSGTVFVDVEDASIHRDIDTPEDYRALIAEAKQ